MTSRQAPKDWIHLFRFSQETNAHIAQKFVKNLPGPRLAHHIGAHDLGIGQKPKKAKLSQPAEHRLFGIDGFKPMYGKVMMDMQIVGYRQPDVYINQKGCRRFGHWSDRASGSPCRG